MTTLCEICSTEAAARRAVRSLRAAGVADRDIRLLARRGPRDVRREPVGGFAGPVGPDAPVGTFGGRVAGRRQGRGGFAGAPDQQRQGSFADTDRVTIVAYGDDAEHVCVTSLRGARRLLRGVALGDGAVDRAVDALHLGRAVVMVEIGDQSASEMRGRLERPAA
jgi:hypothetical protein